MEELLKFLNSIYPLATELQIYLLNNVQKETPYANKIILREGDVCDWIAYLEKGLLKIYHVLEDGSERVIWYLKDGDIIGSMKSYYRGCASKLIIRAMEDSVMRKIKKTQLDMIYQKYPEFNMNGRILTEAYYAKCEDHCELLGMTPKERYQKLQRDYPWMVNDTRIKNYMLADYLGIDKTTLSKYRNGK